MNYYHHWLGDEYDKPEEPRVRVSYSNFDYLEGLPDDELIEPERGVPDYTPMPEERPSDYGPLEIDISGLEDE